jgi:hypothetical protein
MSLQIQVTADVANAGKQIEDFSKRSRVALNSLSLVAQDLPFGFIGIQNNLPAVISSFGELTREAGGVGGALKQLGSALIGPAGLFFAFSVTTSIITSLVQKYGSLGAAITDIFGLQLKLRDLQNSLNVALADTVGKTAGEVANLKSLQNILTSTNSTLKERSGAYAELNKAYPGILQGIDKEKALSGELNEIIATRIKLFATQIELEGKADALRQLISKSAQEQLQLGAKIKTGGYFDVLGLQLKGFFQTGDAGIGGVFKSIQNTFAKTNAETKFYSETLNDVNKELVVINEEVNKLIKLQKTQKKETDDSAFSFYKYNGRILGQEEAFSRYVVGQTNLQVAAIDKLIKARVKYRKETSLEKATELVPKVISGEAQIIKNQKFLDTQAIAAEFAIARELIDGVFFNPIAESFENFINTGKFTFDEFAKNIKANIAKIVAQIAASRIVELLGSIFAGPIAGGLAQGGGFLSAIGNILPAFRANTRFDGVRPLATGGGQKIDLVLRGTDLVGAINRTNSQISRVG